MPLSFFCDLSLDFLDKVTNNVVTLSLKVDRERPFHFFSNMSTLTPSQNFDSRLEFIDKVRGGPPKLINF